MSAKEMPRLWTYHGRRGGSAAGLRWAWPKNQTMSSEYMQPTKGAVRWTAAAVRAEESAKPKSCLRLRKQTSMVQRPA